LEYEAAGAGRPACLTHQYTGVSVQHPLAEMLASVFTCYAVNARGIGASGPVRREADLGMEALADDLEAARLALGLPPWVMVGASTGGMVALEYALRHPDGLAGLILVGTAASNRFAQGSIFDPAHPRAEEMGQAWAALATGTPQGMAEWRRVVWSLSVLHPEQTPRPAGMRSAFSLERLARLRHDLPGFDVEAQLGQIAAPTLIVVGRYDPQCPVENSERMAAAIPGALLGICEQSGHFPYIEQPDMVYATLGHFAAHLGR
jgi:proline iminopeptidase